MTPAARSMHLFGIYLLLLGVALGVDGAQAVGAAA